MFNNIYGSDFSSVFSPKLLAFAVIGVFTIYFLSIGFTLLVEKSNYSRGAMIQAIYRSNFVLMGLPIAAKDKLGMTAVLVAVVVPIYNMLAVITLEIFRGQKINVLKILKGIAKNPLIIGSVLGLLSVAFNISLPETIDKTVSDIAAVATPLALIGLCVAYRTFCIAVCGFVIHNGSANGQRLQTCRCGGCVHFGFSVFHDVFVDFLLQTGRFLLIICINFRHMIYSMCKVKRYYYYQ